MDRTAKILLALITLGMPSALKAGPETWSCQYVLESKKTMTVTQQWIVSGNCTSAPDPGPDCRMTAPRGKGFYLVAHNDERLLVGFHKFWDEKGGGASTYVIIEKNTGLYMEIDDIVVTAMGPRYRDTATPGIRTGHCTLAEIVPVDRKRPQ